MTAAAATDLRLPWRTHLVDSTTVIDADGNAIATMHGDYETEWAAMEARAAFIVVAALSHHAMKEALEGLLAVVDAFHAFCRDPKRPCGEYGAECPISMGEWIEEADKEAVTKARAALSRLGPPGFLDNARLIAAASDLLAACKGGLHALQMDAAHRSEIEDLEAAIAKAECR